MFLFNTKRVTPDTRPASAAAEAIAKSLRCEPSRWHIADGDDEDTLLVHDSGVAVNVEGGWVDRPFYMGEPEANRLLLQRAADEWVAATVAAPPKPVSSGD